MISLVINNYGGESIMAVKIRLQRKGSKKAPFYRVVVADSRAAVKSEKIIEKIGTYNPLTNPATVDIDEELALNWLQDGAQPSDTVKSLLKDLGVMETFHNAKYNK